MPKSQHKKSLSGGKHKKRHTKFVSFGDAHAMVMRAGVKSRKQFWDWIDSESIAYIPRQPHHKYKEWVSWNHFLGTNNSWEANGYKPGNYRPYWEAVRWSQANAVENKLTTMKEWLAWYGDNDVPTNIPKRPDAYYDEWAGWGTWLGTTIKGKIMTAENAHGILAFVVEKGNSDNVITMRLERGGASALEAAWLAAKELNQEFKVVKMFAYDPDQYAKFQGIYEMCSTKYQGQDRVRLVHNVDNFVWETSTVFDMVR